MSRSTWSTGDSFDRDLDTSTTSLNQCEKLCISEKMVCANFPPYVRTKNFANIPEPLRGSRRWVSFQVNRQPDGSTKKFPLKINGSPARSDHPEDWSTLPEVTKAIDFSIGQYPAIALGSDYPLRVLDLDNCISEGTLSTLAKDVLAASRGCYIERSVSERGLHILVWASENKVPCHPIAGLEVYGGAPRFIVMTGDLWGDV